MATIVAYGEIMMRLSADAIATSSRFDACYGGTEANVLACLHGLGHNVRYLSALPEGPLGKATFAHLHSYGVNTDNIVVRGDTMGLYFAENGDSSRGSNVVYQRKYSEFTRLSESDFDYDRAFDGADLFHISGISFALSPSSRAVAYRLMKEAHKRGVAVSFDFNYRSSLWSVEEAAPQLVEAAKNADIWLASTRDLETFVRMTPQQVMENGNCRYLVLRDRKILSSCKHSVAVTVFARRDNGTVCFTLPERSFDVEEKIGGGDAFDGCMLHALLSGQNIEDATRFATAGFVLKHRQKGDAFAVNASEIERLASTWR